MTVNANPAVSGPYLTDGVTRAWPFGFKIVDTSHIKIVAVNIATGVEQEFKVGLVVPPGDINQDNGGAVTYPAAPTAALPTGFEIYTVRDVPFSQPNQIGNQGNFFPETHEKTFDLLAMQNQQTLEIARRAVIAGYGQDPSTFVDDLLQASATAVAAAQAAAADAVQTAADRVQTGLDRVQTGLDRVATAADRVATAADRVQTGNDKTATAADRVQTGLDRTAASGFASATAADRIQTGLDASATAADRVATGQDRVATAADRVQTGLDRAAAAASAASIVPSGLIKSVVHRVFMASGTYTPDAKMLYAIIECIGGGGSGGGAVGIAGAGRPAGGGGSGGYSRKVVSKGNIGASQPVTVGAGGASAAGAVGNAGGTSSVGSLISALGGPGGNVNNGGGSDPTGTAGASVGDIALAGTRGQGAGLATNLQVLLIGGSGGDGPFGGGGPGARNGNGGAGSMPGSGGGGAAANSNAVTSDAGGPGAAGLVIITEFLS